MCESTCFFVANRKMINLLYNLLIYPIIIVYEIIYNIFNNLFHSSIFINNAEFFSIVIVSLSVNILTFSLYKKADEIQKEVRIKKERMSKWINHINKNFNYEESDEFMTNADTPYLILNGIAKELKNPYTGNEISMDYKNDNNDFCIISSVKPQVGYYIGKEKFISENGYWVNYNKLENRIYNGINWKIIFEEEVVYD